jgi:hypothetical protein
MIFSQILDFTTENLIFSESFCNLNTNLLSSNFNFIFLLSFYSDSTFLNFEDDVNLYSRSLITYINQIEDLDLYNNLENIASVYHYSIPNVRLSYPEPFIASPSFMHSDL